MKKFISTAAVLIVLFGMTNGSWAAMLDARWTDIWVAQNSQYAASHSGCYGYLLFSNQRFTADHGYVPGQNSSEKYTLASGLSDNYLYDRPELIYINLAGIVSDGIMKVDFSDISADCSLIGLFSMSEYGILDETFWRLFGDSCLTGSMQVADDGKPDPASPIPAPLLLLSTVLMGLIGFRRTATA